jgi:hypothetical protein
LASAPLALLALLARRVRQVGWVVSAETRRLDHGSPLTAAAVALVAPTLRP